MLKEYRNKETFKAEQFDGSEEMMKEYEITKLTQGNGKNIFAFETVEGPFWLNIGDWIATEANGYRWTIKDDYFKKTYEEVE
ncbi:hypothetical protein AAHB41_05625 [Pediococcus pentosaceus]|uniref:hypothetical protein n=1 Tax=Pediococcus pentosaceus TaxID=1255 RepID=UPI00232D3408|nr:hypothetical protein [Pediococcus pentosaceus]MDB1561856.1 hypothetical protein [Pediococcus pentosaceus]